MKKDTPIQLTNTTADFLIFTAETGNPKIEVRVEGEMVWLTQKLMAELFEVDVRTISEHLQNIFKTRELKEDSVVRNFRITASDVSHEFYALVQNKFHFAITGKTAPEIIHGSANANLPHMGLTTWKKSPAGRILQSDVTTAKNYLEENEIKQLERAVTGFFDYIEGLIERSNAFTMKEFAESVDKFLNFNEYKILDDKGRISKTDADEKAISEYKEFNKHQKIESDFDREVKKILGENKVG